MKKYKILLFNTQYLLGLNGTNRQTLLHWYRYFHCPMFIQKRIMNLLIALIKKENPDICCFIEMENNSVFKILKELLKNYSVKKVENKYGEKSMLRKIPGYRKKGNAVFCKNNLTIKSHFLKNGTKKLIQEVLINHKLSLFVGHFSLLKRTRKKQFMEIKKLIQNKREVIICGDFNIFDGFEELDELIKTTGLKIVNKFKEKTYPAYNPSRTFSLFVCSKGVKVKKLKVLKNIKISDHLPVIMEFEV